MSVSVEIAHLIMPVRYDLFRWRYMTDMASQIIGESPVY